MPAVQGLWRGTVPGLLLTVPYTAVQFAALQEARAAAQKWGLMQTSLAPAVSFVSGAVAGAAATVASYPFDLLRTTLAAQGEPKVQLHVRLDLESQSEALIRMCGCHDFWMSWHSYTQQAFLGHCVPFINLCRGQHNANEIC